MGQRDEDCARACARAVVDMVGHLLRPEERREFFGMVAAAVAACLRARDDAVRARRLEPSNN